MPVPQKPTKRLQGFTLIEILVVAFIISILAGLLVPAIIEVQKIAKDKICKNNLKNVGTAMGIYLTQNNNFLPQGREKTSAGEPIPGPGLPAPPRWYKNGTFRSNIAIHPDFSLSWQQIVDEVPQSPHVMIGLLAFILLIPLALTSTQSMARRLGHRWKKLHSLIYLAGCLGIMHFFMLVKADIWEPLLYGSLLAFLLAIRIELDAMPSKKILRTQILIALTIAALNQILTISA